MVISSDLRLLYEFKLAFANLVKYDLWENPYDFAVNLLVHCAMVRWVQMVNLVNIR